MREDSWTIRGNDVSLNLHPQHHRVAADSAWRSSAEVAYYQSLSSFPPKRLEEVKISTCYKGQRLEN